MGMGREGILKETSGEQPERLTRHSLFHFHILLIYEQNHHIARTSLNLYLIHPKLSQDDCVLWACSLSLGISTPTTCFPEQRRPILLMKHVSLRRRTSRHTWFNPPLLTPFASLSLVELPSRLGPYESRGSRGGLLRWWRINFSENLEVRRVDGTIHKLGEGGGWV
jgi:hypothetical protein